MDLKPLFLWLNGVLNRGEWVGIRREGLFSVSSQSHCMQVCRRLLCLSFFLITSKPPAQLPDLRGDSGLLGPKSLLIPCYQQGRRHGPMKGRAAVQALFGGSESADTCPYKWPQSLPKPALPHIWKAHLC